MNPILDFEPLDLEVVPGIKVRDLATRKECDDALMRLSLDMESIQAQIARAEEDPSTVLPGWRTRAQSAIRWKKRIKAAITARALTLRRPPDLPSTARAEILLDTFRQELGDAEFERIREMARAQYLRAFDEISSPTQTVGSEGASHG
jgi:hypothetical protein